MSSVNASLEEWTEATNYDGLSYYFVGAHHFVVLVLQDVAVPDVAAHVAFEAYDDASDHAGIGADRVLPAGLRLPEFPGLSAHMPKAPRMPSMQATLLRTYKPPSRVQ